VENNKITFKQLTENFIYYKLGFKQVYESEILKEWFELSKQQTIISEDTSIIKRLQRILVDRSSKWNEFELSEWFIGPIMSLIDFNSEDLKLFAFRDIEATVKDYELSGKPDAMIATGIDSPITPYFCFHKYKRQTDPNGNPQTQLLGSMITAQELNNNEKPIYGIYVIGFTWRFVVLHGNTWCESNLFSADDNSIYDIYKILLALKQIILGN